MCLVQGGCWTPNAIWPGIILSHWGRTDYPHYSNTAYGYDNYSAAYEPAFKAWQPHDWRDDISGHACFDPKKVHTSVSGPSNTGRQQS